MLQPEGTVEQIRTIEGRRAKRARRASDPEYLDDELKDGAVFAPLYTASVIDEVLGVLKSGKEATVYLARGGAKAEEDLLAIKVYKPSQHRSFKNAAVYNDGRYIGDDRVERAMRKKTGFGHEASQFMWVGREYARLVELHGAGVAVPKPYTTTGAAIVMQYLGDEDGCAPRLRDVALDVETARSVWRWLWYDIEMMLGSFVVHGDLSPYNVLWWQDRAWLIDFPQAVDPRKNRSARMLLDRDIANCAKYFQRAGVDIDPQREAIDLWRRYMRAEL